MTGDVAKIEPEQHEGRAVEARGGGREAITPMELLQLAMSQGADLEKMERLMDMQERWEANAARKEFVAAKAAFRAEAPTISKNKHVGFNSRNGGARTDYDYATLDNIADALSPILGKHGLAYSWNTEQLDGGLIRVTCTLTHQRGHSESVSLQAKADDSGNKNAIQAIGSTISFLERYTLLAITGTATADQDDDGKGATAFITDEQKDRIVGLIREVGADTKEFLKYMGAETVDRIPADQFGRALNALEAKKKQAQKAPAGEQAE